jgi:Flp pilus assembly protein TadB
VFAADQDRERAAAALREHYVRGRLTLDELSARTARVLRARTREDVRGALAGLPVMFDVSLAARSVARGAMLVVFTAAYLVFCFALLLVFGLTLLIHGASASELVGFLVVWLVPTYLLARLWRRRPG